MITEFALESEINIEFLRATFPQIEFNFYRTSVGECSFLSVFSCWVDNEELLEQFWSRINNLIGTEYQVNLKDEFSSWNIYLAFFIPKKVTTALKYDIENDAFFMRKIVFDSRLEPIDKKSITTYLNNHILGKDISIEHQLSQKNINEHQLSQKKINEQKYSLITQNLLTADLSLGRTGKDKALREAWLDRAILEVSHDEV